MQRKLMTAGIAFALLMSLGACGFDGFGTTGSKTGEPSASSKSALEQNGVPEGVANQYAGQKSDTWDSKNQFTQDKQINTQGKESLGDDLQNAGEQAKNGLDTTARDIANGAKNAGRDLKEGARDVTNGVKDAAGNTKTAAK